MVPSLLRSSRKSTLLVGFGVVGTLLLVLFGTVSNSPSSRILAASTTSVKTAALAQPLRNLKYNPIQHLVRGDLPEYVPTQKALETTKAHLYNITAKSPWSSPVLHPWSVTVSCKKCANDAPHFYMRAYGQSIAAGQRRTYQGEDGTMHHEFTFLPTDLRLYTVEVVMTYSNAPDFTAFPLAANAKKPEFEGILLPGFPVTMQSRKSPLKKEPDHQCTQADVAWPFPYSTESMPVARWKLISKSASMPPWPTKEDKHYVEPPNMLGMDMHYQHVDCISPTDQQVKAGLHKMVRESEKPIRIILFGDSIMSLQEMAFRKLAAGVPGIQITSLNGNNWHIHTQLYADTYTELLKLEEHRVVVFNLGLLDVQTMCSKRIAGLQPCGEQYRSRFFELLKTLHLLPADLKIFQTTTAAWPLYGNFNIPGETPTFLNSPEMVAHFNEIALETVREFDSGAFVVTDGYAMTAARPDNRQVVPETLRMVNPGQEVVSALTREWVTIVIDAMKDGGDKKLAVLRKHWGTPGRIMAEQ